MQSTRTERQGRITTSGKQFKLTELEHDGEHPEYWRGRLEYRVFSGRTATTVCSVVLQREAKGSVIFDTGKRGKGGRERLTKAGRDLQKAVREAEKRLEAMAQHMVAHGIMDEAVRAGGGDCTIQDIRHIYFSVKEVLKEGEERKRNSIVAHHAHNMDNIFDWLLEVNGPTFRVSQIDEAWVDRMVPTRLQGIVFEKVQRRGQNMALGPVQWNTAIQNLEKFASAVKLACSETDERGEYYQRANPFASELVNIPAKRPPARKLPTGIEHYVRLMIEVERGTEVLPAPVDRADKTGQLRLMVAGFFAYGVRREQMRVAKRGHLALTRDEVREMVLTKAHYVEDDDWEHFSENGLWLFEGEDSKNAHRDAFHYTRVLPIPSMLRQEIDLYLKRSPKVCAADPDAPLFPSEEDASRPVADSTLFRATLYAYVRGKDGRPVRDSRNRKMWKLDKTGEPTLLCTADGRTHPGGRYAVAVNTAREDMKAAGEDWESLWPYEQRGTKTHGWRKNLESTIADLQYLRTVVDPRGQPLDLARHVDYLLQRSMDTAVRFEHYVMLDPHVLLGLAELRDSDEVLRERGVRVRDELASAKERLSRSLARLRSSAGQTVDGR